MDAIIYGLVLAIAAAVLAFIIKMSKQKDWDDYVKDKIQAYEFVFTVVGTIVQSLDEKLYTEMKEVIDKLNELYETENVTAEDLQKVIDEAQDVFDRAKELYAEYKNKDTTS